VVPWLEDDHRLPPTHLALGPGSEAPGLLAASQHLSVARLEEAYGQGVFPWYSPGQPVLWWAPDPRMVLPVAEFRLSHSLRKALRRFLRTPGCELRFDSAFEAVISACAGTPREGQDGTWITAELAAAYVHWHRLGRVHSIETWMEGRLVGALYCVNLGRMVFGESMFSHRSDASKFALAGLVAFCRAHGLPLIDCQQNTRHLASLGAREISRPAFEQALAELLRPHPSEHTACPAPHKWTYDFSHWQHLGLNTEPSAAPQPPSP
jgi:leucyl/phenylalanyl-tRNA---protein transferase